MLAIKARYDGKKVVLPDEISAAIPPGEVIVVFGAARVTDDEIADWEKAQEASFAKAWDNDEDAVYDAL
jgi:hypothetical protein